MKPTVLSLPQMVGVAAGSLKNSQSSVKTYPEKVHKDGKTGRDILRELAMDFELPPEVGDHECGVTKVSVLTDLRLGIFTPSPTNGQETRGTHRSIASVLLLAVHM
jgi:hypothetical protein